MRKVHVVFLVLVVLVFCSIFQTELRLFTNSQIWDLKIKIRRGLYDWWSARNLNIINDPRYTRKKVILLYTTLFGAEEWDFLPVKYAENLTVTSKCKVYNCEVTYDNDRLGESDVVIFHARDMPSLKSLKDISKRLRPVHQRWVYFISESPLNTPDPSNLNGVFNWTMTYKKQSDIWLPYQRYEKLAPSDSVPEVIDYAANKNKVQGRKLALWVVSHCGRKRDKLVEKLQDLISIDVGGSCANEFKNDVANCNSQGREGCMEKIKNYKFYLSFENAFCDQYVTEKYWYNALEHDAVPIVLGGGPYDDPKVAIPGSFINAQDFKTVKGLADYLIYLDKNDTAYNEYFTWKQTYKLPFNIDWPYPDVWSCDICEKLHFDDKRKIYDKLSDFWSLDDCKNRDAALNEMLEEERNKNYFNEFLYYI